jgi:predicted Zn-dependent protease
MRKGIASPRHIRPHHVQCDAFPPGASSQSRIAPRARFSRLARIALIACAVFACSGLTGCRTKSFLSTKQEVNLGKEASREVEQQFRVDTKSPDAERVRTVGARLLPHLDRPGINYTFKVLDNKEINAFSLPGGPVYVFRGLLDMMGDDDDALASVLGHECGHVAARHAARQLSSSLTTNILINIFIPNPTYNQIAGLGAGVVGLKYSREDEYEADRRGLSYSSEAGYDPEGMVRFFDKLARMEHRQGGNDPEWLRDHPLTQARIDKAQAIIERKDYRYGVK